MARKDYIDKINKNMEKLTKDELKDVATLTNVQFGVRLKVAEKEYWEKEVEAIKSKLQQQDLPVVPECVAEWIECVKGKNNNALALLDDEDMPDDVNEWLFFQRSDDNINLILRAWLDGYTVEKSDKCMVKLGALYFKCWNDVDAVFIIDDQPGAYESAFVFKKREDAEKVAQLVGGRVVKN